VEPAQRARRVHATQRAERCRAERCGFVIEGHAKAYLLINGRWEDHVLVAITNPDWVAPQRAS